MSETTRKFETDRTRRFRSATLSESDECTITNIEKFGCEVIDVASNAEGAGWSYSVDIFDTCGGPEIITVGLPWEIAQTLINNAAYELRNGTNLAAGRHREMIDEVECEFRAVDPKWAKHLMGWASWFYDGDDFPVLQAVYPDLENRFPEEPGFNKSFQQPLMQPDRPMTNVEQDFWASADPDSSLFDWKFPDPPHTGVYLSEAVHRGEEQITYVSHDIEDGAWQFLGDSMTAGRKGVLSCFHHPIDQDPSLNDLADLPLGWWAEREKHGEPWIRHEHESSGNSEDE